MTATAIPTGFQDAFPADVDFAACTVTTYGALCDAHFVCPAESYTSIDDDAPVILFPGWRADDGNAEVEYPDAETCREAAQRYVDEGGWNDAEGETFWVNVSAWRLAYTWDPDDQDLIELRVDDESHLIAIEPDEPECSSGDGHDWQSPHGVLGGLEDNPGVWCNGGGVIIREVCAHCGVYRVTDTWAQDSATGQQGLESVEYLDSDDDSLDWIRARFRRRVSALVDEYGSAAVENGICAIQGADTAEVSSDGEVSTDDHWVDDEELPELADELEKRLNEPCEADA
jgi:hypothetical protein